MSDTQAAELSDLLRAPFPASQIGKLPKGGVELDYVGHGAVTSRLLEVDPEWNWEPAATDDGLPRFVTDAGGNPTALWIRLTVCGVTRLGVGTCKANQFDAEKVLIGDAIRNAAMRFGVALDLWIRGHAEDDEKVSAGSKKHAYPPSIDAGAVFVEKDRRNLAFLKMKEVIGGDEERKALARTIADQLGVVMAEATAEQAERVEGQLRRVIANAELPESPQSPQEPPGAVVAVNPATYTSQAILDATAAKWVPNVNEVAESTNALAERASLLKKAATIVETTTWLEDGLRAVLGHKGKKSISRAFAEMRLSDLRTAVELIQAAATKDAFATVPEAEVSTVAPF